MGLFSIGVSLFPLNLNLAGRRVLVVGAGRIAARKISQLIPSGALVTVVAPAIDDAIRHLGVDLLEREYRDGDVEGFRLVFTATGDPTVDGRVHDDAERAGIWVNSADDPAHCTFTLPATLRRGDLCLTVSTEGRSPAVASFVRARLAEAIGDGFAVLLERVAHERAAVIATGGSTEDIDWFPIISRTADEIGLDSPLLRAVPA